MLGCIHNTMPIAEDGSHLDPALACGRRPIRVAHGWLCGFHYREQQKAMPVRERKPLYMDDEALCKAIVEYERRKIEQGTVRKMWYAGVTLRLLEA